MQTIIVQGGKTLHGKITISGSKNAALPLMIATLLTDAPCQLHNLPNLSDTRSLTLLLKSIGSEISVCSPTGHAQEYCMSMNMQAKRIVENTASYDFVSVMRASFWIIAPLLARTGYAKVSLPGGCAIGARPIDLILYALTQLGAEILIEEGYIIAKTKNHLKGNTIAFPKITVGGTHVAMLAATLADGVTTIENAAKEPEIVDVAACLNKMGADIKGAGTSTIQIIGKTSLGGVTHTVIPDRIETGTFLITVAATGGEVLLTNTKSEFLEFPISVLKEIGVEIIQNDDSILVKRDPKQSILPCNLETAPYPGFPTDLQAQMMALMCSAKGTSTIKESIFENRFMHVPELIRLNAKITYDRDLATIIGSNSLKGAPVMATDLRASVSLVIAGLKAKGKTTISRIYHLDRGFEKIEQKLANCGAVIERRSDNVS